MESRVLRSCHGFRFFPMRKGFFAQKSGNFCLTKSMTCEPFSEFPVLSFKRRCAALRALRKRTRAGGVYRLPMQLGSIGFPYGMAIAYRFNLYRTIPPVFALRLTGFELIPPLSRRQTSFFRQTPTLTLSLG